MGRPPDREQARRPALPFVCLKACEDKLIQSMAGVFLVNDIDVGIPTQGVRLLLTTALENAISGHDR